MKELLDSREYVMFWFGKSDLTVQGANSRVSTFNTFYLDYIAMYKQMVFARLAVGDKAPKPLPERELRLAFDEYIDIKGLTEVGAACEHLSFNGSTLEPLREWVTAVTGTVIETDLAVMAHWLWLIKRKSLGLPVKHHIMPIIFGPQNGGKTTAIEALSSPIKKFKLNLKLSSLADERMYKGFSYNLVAFFDELQNIDKTDLNVLKNQITTQQNTFRPLHTNLLINGPMNCTFIGASNKPINENFSDSTGMRRFYQINALPRVLWEEINRIDYVAIWRCIDETSREGYLTGAVLSEVQVKQESLVNKDDFTTFLEESGLAPKDGAETQLIATSQLYVGYQDWCAKNGVKRPYSSVYFNTRLKNLGFQYHVGANGRKAYYTIAKDASIDFGTLIIQNKLKAV